MSEFLYVSPLQYNCFFNFIYLFTIFFCGVVMWHHSLHIIRGHASSLYVRLPHWVTHTFSHSFPDFHHHGCLNRMGSHEKPVIKRKITASFDRSDVPFIPPYIRNALAWHASCTFSF